MKNILTIILSAICLTACSQPATIQDINKAIAVFSNTLDSTIVKKMTTTVVGPVNIDTLNIGDSTSGVFLLVIKATCNGSIAEGEKIVTIKKSGTSTVLSRDFIVMKYSGDSLFTNTTWQVQNVGNIVMIQVVGLANKTILWTYSKQLIL